MKYIIMFITIIIFIVIIHNDNIIYYQLYIIIVVITLIKHLFNGNRLRSISQAEFTLLCIYSAAVDR